jgi:type I restriction-modification system DNA methylase subunit
MSSQHEKEFLKIFDGLCYSRNSWQVWTDFITATAMSLANRTETRAKQRESNEKEYEQCIERLGGMEKPAELFSIVIQAMTENPDQDFLGHLYMSLELGNHWAGQFFTPYHLCEMMSKINYDGIAENIKNRGWTTIYDCACGAGATLIAAANVMRKNELDYQNHALFIAQDISRIVALMCYIQLSLLGCAGYVVIGDTLSNPATGVHALFPDEKEGQEIFYTPMFSSQVWEGRRKWNFMDLILGLGKENNNVGKS